MGLVAPRHVGSSQTRDRTYVPCTGRWILNHCATREVPWLVHSSCVDTLQTWWMFTPDFFPHELICNFFFFFETPTSLGISYLECPLKSRNVSPQSGLFLMPPLALEYLAENLYLFMLRSPHPPGDPSGQNLRHLWPVLLIHSLVWSTKHWSDVSYTIVIPLCIVAKGSLKLEPVYIFSGLYQTCSPNTRKHIRYFLGGPKRGPLTFEVKKYLPSYLVFRLLDSQHNSLQTHPLSWPL